MKHKVKVQVPVEKRGFLGTKKTVMEKRVIEVDGKTYKKLKKEWNKRPFSIEKMMRMVTYLTVTETFNDYSLQIKSQ